MKKNYTSLGAGMDIRLKNYEQENVVDHFAASAINYFSALTRWILLLLLITSAVTTAQVAPYTFSQPAGSSYTPIPSGATRTASVEVDDNTGVALSIGFTFNYGGTDYTQLIPYSNGFLVMGNSVVSNVSPNAYAPSSNNNGAVLSSSGSYPTGAIAPLNFDMTTNTTTFTISGTRTNASNTLTLLGASPNFTAAKVRGGMFITGTGIPANTYITAVNIAAGTVTLSANASSTGASTTFTITPSSFLTLTEGSAPNRIYTMQWTGFKRFSVADELDFQVKLYESTNVIEFYYNTAVVASAAAAGTSDLGQVGLRGVVNTDFNNRATATDWGATIAGANNAATMLLSSAIKPVAGQKYIFTPPPTILTSVASLTNYTQINGTPTAQQTYTVTGFQLTNAVTVTVPAGYEISTTSGSFTPGNTAVTLPQVSGLLTGQPVSVYVRLNAAVNGTYNGNITHASSPATTKNVAVTGTNVSALTGTKTIDNTLATAGNNYASFTAAINALNLGGIGAGGVTFNVVAGQIFAEDPPAITATGTNANQVIFQRSGAGANPVIRPTGGGGATDAGITIGGGDYFTFDGIDINIATGSAVEFGYYVRNASATDGAQNNTIKNTAITLNRSNTASVGIQQSTATTATNATGANSVNKYYNVTISNAYSGIYLLGTAAVPDLTCEIGIVAGGTTTIGGATANDIGNGALQTWGIRATNQSGSKIFNTEVRNVTVTGAVLSDGIFLEGFLGTNEINNNSVHDIRNSSTSATNAVTGIRFSHNTSGSNIVRVYNNFVYSITSGYTGSASGTRQIKGIHSSGTGGSTAQIMNVDFNSVRIDNSTSATISSTCWEMATSTPVYNVRNNIFANVTGAQTGAAKHHTVVSSSGSSIGGSGSTWNRNVLYLANTTNGFTGLNAGSSTDYATLANWQAHTAAPDANSFNQNPQFNSATDLKINPALGTPVESNGSYFTGAITWVPLDKEGDTRNATTPDIGADEGTFIALVSNDVQATAFVVPLNAATVVSGATLTPQASFTNNGQNAQTSVTVRYRIVNASAVEVYNFTASIATLASGATTTVTFPTSGALGAPGTYTIFAKAELGTDTVTANDQISGTLNVIGPLSGDILVGTAQPAPYNNLATAVARLQLVGVSAATRFLLTDASYDLGTTALQINAITGSSGTNTFTLKPNTGVTSAITNNVSTASIILNAADNVIIDGSNAAIANTICPPATATRNLTIANTNSGTSSAVVWLQSTGADGATGNTVKNTIITGNSNTTTLVGIGLGNSTIGISTSLGAGNNTNTIENNDVSKVQNAIYSQGASAASKNTGNNFNKNVVTAASPNNPKTGITLGFENNVNVNGNQLVNLSSTTDNFGISLGILSGAFSGTSLTGNEVTNATVTKNIVGALSQTSTNSGAGIIQATLVTAGVTNNISNNMVYDVNVYATTPDIGAGILIGGGTGTTNVYFNSVSMTGTRNSLNVMPSFALAIGGSNPVVNVKNNILVNTQTSSGGGKSYAIGLGYATPFTNLISNNNDLYATGGTGGNLGSTGVLTASATDVPTLLAWQGTPGKDANSINTAIVFSGSPFVLSVTASNPANAALNGIADATTGITDDIGCDLRTGTGSPDIGADEFTPPVCAGATGGTAVGDFASCGPALTQTITNSGYSTGTNSGYQWISSTNIGDYPNAGTATGISTPATFATGPVATTTYYWLRVTCATNSSTANSNRITVTINPPPAVAVVTGAGTFCTSATINASNGGDGTMYFQGTISGGVSTATPAVSQVVSASGTYYFRAQNPTTLCWGPEGSVVVVIQTTAGITGTNATTCVGGTTNLAASATNCTGFSNAGTTISGSWNASTDQIAKRPTTSIADTATCGFDATATRNYVATPFQVSATGNYAFEMNDSASFDGMAYITSGAFVPGNCLGGGTFIKGDDDSGTGTSGDEPRITATLTAGVTYTLYSTTYTLGTGTYTGAFSWTVTPPVGEQIMLSGSGTIVWYTAASGGNSFGSGSPFNPVGVLNSGLANTNTAGTTTFYAACSFSTACRTAVTFTVNPLPTVDVGPAVPAVCQNGTTVSLGGSFGGNATGAVWSDTGAGGSFANNSGTTPGTTTYTASASAVSPITLRLTTTGGTCGTTFLTKQLIVNQGTLYFTDSDGDGFDSGAPQVLLCTPTAGYILTTNGADCIDIDAEINPNHVEVLANGKDDNCDGSIDEIARTSYLQPAQCGTTLSHVANTLYAFQLFEAQGYRFEVTGPVGPPRSFDSATNAFTLTSLPGGITYNTTYAIRVALKLNGFWRAYGTSCNITTPAVPATTNLVPTQCGATLTSLSNILYANQVPAASQYRFEVTGGVQGVRTFDTSLNRFSLLNLTGGAAYHTTYSVRVALFIGGVWQAYGTACDVTTPLAPLPTNLQPSQCGSTISNSWTTIYAIPVSEATGYRFEVFNGAITQYIDTSVPRFNIHQIPAGYAANTAYTIRVAILFESVYQAFGTSCTFNTSAGLTKLAAVDSVFIVKASPNPFTNTFRLDAETSSQEQVEVKVYDMIGKLVETRQVNAAELSAQEVGARYSSGVYNVIVTQGINVKTLRIIKR
jgi:hypothetical protein